MSTRRTAARSPSTGTVVRSIGAMRQRTARHGPAAQLPAPRPCSCFAHDSIEAIYEALRRDGTDWACTTLATLQRMSPMSLKVTLRLLRTGARLSMEDCFKLEYRLVRHFLAGNDMHEGVRAVLIDKDNKPKWDVSGATDQAVEACFTPRADGDKAGGAGEADDELQCAAVARCRRTLPSHAAA